MSENGQLWFSTQTNGFPLSTLYLILGVFGQNLTFDLVVAVADFKDNRIKKAKHMRLPDFQLQ
jgi:hypothetical protein